ncbi:MAG: hypothetical protein Q8R82_17725 [Hyphomonadaceae bacterium]|nr:hypothetical protein [Hyphomonadaceae bacterium]
MGGVILLFLLAILIVVLVTPAIRTRFGRTLPPTPPSDGGEEPPHEVIVPRLDDHRARKSTPRDEPRDS